MESTAARIRSLEFTVHAVNTLVIGSGAAALRAALALHERGQQDIAIVTEKWGGGTSNNSGSDKQTYYKLSLQGPVPDSPLEMAGDLFAGGCMHGDIALCEAQISAQAFYELVHLGIPFPHDRYGGYPGYRTDHDPRGRAPSAGPRTSHYMFEALAGGVTARKIRVFDRCLVISLLADSDAGRKKVFGAAAMDLDAIAHDNYGIVLFNAVNIVLASGGPGGLYQMSVYPPDQIGSIGLGLRIGAVAHNLTESQFGLASLKHRWNVSGSYQQVIPRYLSTNAEGQEERDFLGEFFPETAEMAGAIFRKGYQWPFDPRKVLDGGSSLIDLAVHRETVLRGRRVFLDFTRNPVGSNLSHAFDLSAIPACAREYLGKSGALQDRPIERLLHLNPQAVELYRDHGIDLANEYLEIAVCAQHNNGGLRGNCWWESNVGHLFPVGEVNGTHGIYRPGGSALNAGQVGALRAALYIAHNYSTRPPDTHEFSARAEEAVCNLLDQAAGWLARGASAGPEGLHQYLWKIRERMTRHAAQIRERAGIRKAIAHAWRAVKEIAGEAGVTAAMDLPAAFRTLELAITHAVYLEAIGAYMDQGGASRGSYLIIDPEGDYPCEALGGVSRFSLARADAFVSRHILELSLDSALGVHKEWVPVRPIPAINAWFENVWKEYVDGTVFMEQESSS
jgi:succinate dehydrogenase/fumarate reductase flavoprotein subunit